MKTKFKLAVSVSKNIADCTYFAGSINIFGMLYIIPFKVEHDSFTDTFRLSTNKLHQTICGIIHANSILLLGICGHLKCFTGGLESKRFEYIIFALDFMAETALSLIVMKILWFDQKLIEQFLNTKSYRNSIVPRYKVLLAVSSCLIIFVCDIQLNRSSDLSRCSYHTLELGEHSSFIQVCLLVFKWAFFILETISKLFHYIGEALCCTLAINMWQICKKHVDKLDRDTPFRQGLDIYNEHRLTIEAVNSFSSSLFFTNLMSSLVYYAQAPIVYYFGKQAYDYERVIMLAYIFISLMIWGFAGQCHALTRKSIKEWVNGQQQKSNESTATSEQFQLAAISYNLDSDPMALSCCFFNITYGFEASMLGLLVSYNILIFQMEEQGNAIKASPSVIQ